MSAFLVPHTLNTETPTSEDFGGDGKSPFSLLTELGCVLQVFEVSLLKYTLFL